MGIKSIVLIASILILSACSGGGGGDGASTSIVSGTAATGIALNGVVNAYGSNGGIVTDIPIDASGNYTADVTGLTAPFFFSAIPTNNKLTAQYSWANGTGTANITPLTTLALFYANGDQDPATLVGAWPTQSAAVTMNLPDALAAVNANFAGIFTAINPALNIDFATYDFFSTEFTIGDKYDQILDLLSVELSSGTPVITVDGATFTFDPNIDISGVDIGGSGDNTGGDSDGGSDDNPAGPGTVNLLGQWNYRFTLPGSYCSHLAATGTMFVESLDGDPTKMGDIRINGTNFGINSGGYCILEKWDDFDYRFVGRPAVQTEAEYSGFIDSVVNTVTETYIKQTTDFGGGYSRVEVLTR